MSKKAQSVIVKGVGSYLPDRVMTNADLASMVETSDEWIVTRTGIHERRIASPSEATSHMAFIAAKRALENAAISTDEIDLLIVGTMTPDYPFPSVACILQNRLGLPSIAAFDVQAACSGFSYAMEVAEKMLMAGNYRNALIIGADKMSSVVDWTDRATCVLFGDGAGAAVLSKVNEPAVGILDSQLGSDGTYLPLLYQEAGGSLNPSSIETISNRQNYLKMNGKELFKVVVRVLEQSILATLDRLQINKEDLACIVPHQANIRIIEALAQRIELPLEKFIINLNKYGNTSAASIPIALDEALRSQKIKKGDLILIVAFGAGLTWSTTLIKWY